MRSTHQRRCRVYRARTIDTVRSSVSSWCRIFSHPLVPFDPPSSGGCSSLAAFVKAFLANCPSSVEEERFAFQSIKKRLPDSCRCMNDELLCRLIEGVIAPPKKLPDGYLRFVAREASKLFPTDWDTTYRNHCYTTSPPLSSTLEQSRSKGGGLTCRIDHPTFLDETLGLSQPSSSSVAARPMVVQSAGKPRPLTKYTEDQLILKPLHKALFDQVSSFHWSLRGDVSAAALDGAGFRRGLGVLVSGDYKSATDNLPLEVAEVVLSVALRNATRVPSGISDYAKRLLRPLFVHRGEEIVVSSGQQMGSLLSFPLLCVQNYLAFRWAVLTCYGRQKFLPVLINGDDILFQSTRSSFPDEWMRVVGAVGLEVEQTKTSIASDFGSLNSTLLRWRGDHLRVSPTLRFGMLRPQPFANSLARSFQSFCVPGLPAQVRFNAALEFMKAHSALIIRTDLSPIELGFVGRLAWRAFRKTGLLRTQKERMRLNPEYPARRLPPLPCVHNVVLGSSDVEFVPSLLPEEELLSSREQCSWKWRLRGQFKAAIRKQELGYWMALSRPSYQFPFIPMNFKLRERDTLWWYRELKERYFAPRPVKPVTRLFMRGVDRLPTFSEAVADGTPPVIGLTEAPDKLFEEQLAMERKLGW